MYASLVLLLPLLASVNAAGGDHYVPHRSKSGNLKRNANPLGGDHYVPHRSKLRQRDALGGDHYVPHRKQGSSRRSEVVELDERGLPITATTTVVVPMTVTETVWVTETPAPAPTSDSSSIPPSESVASSSAVEPTTTAQPSSPSEVIRPPVSSGTEEPSASETLEPSVSESVSPTGSETVEPTPTTSGEPDVEATAPAEPTITADPTSTHHGHGHHSSSDDWHHSSSGSWGHHTSSSDSESLTESDYFSSTALPEVSESASPTTSSQSVKPTASSKPPAHGKRMMNGYFADWSTDTLPPEEVDWSRFDSVDFAFAEPRSDGSLAFTQDSSEDLLHRLTDSAHASGKQVKLSVGGWTGSKHFSNIVATEDGRTNFVSNLVDAVNEYKLDGIDLDWEYPGAAGASGNAINPDDSANYLVFLHQLRAAMPDKLITAATQVWPFYGSNGQPMDDVSEFGELLDWILIMNYDIWGSSSVPGPNAPLNDGCKDSTQPTANAYAAVASWTAAGFPADKITLGVPAYGYLQMSSASQLFGRSWPQPPHKRANSARQSLTVTNDSGGSSDGQVMFDSMIAQGALALVNGEYVGAGGFTRHWDECSSTPWLKSEASGQIITYDDPQSMNLKGQFAAQSGILGCSIFSMDGDYVNGGWPLTDAVRSGMGI